MEEKMLTEVLGKSEEEFLKSGTKWSIALFGQLVGPVWFFYKNAHLSGLIFFLISFAVGFIGGLMGMDQLSYVMFILYLFFGPKLYLWNIKNKISNIVNQNSLDGEDQLMDKARKLKKGNTIALVIYIVGFILYMALLMFLTLLPLFVLY